MTREELDKLTIRTNARDWRKSSIYIVEVGPRGITLRADLRAIAEDELTARAIIDKLSEWLPASSELLAIEHSATDGVTSPDAACERAIMLHKLHAIK